MEYIIIPTEVFEQADKELAKKLRLDNPRKSVDGTEVIMHIECYNRLFGIKSFARQSRSRIIYPIYKSDSHAFEQLINSDAWSTSEDGLITE